jgi:hypothetical protein
VNRSYETAQIIKSGDCYDTPYYNRLVKVVDEKGQDVGYMHIDVIRPSSYKDDGKVHPDVLTGSMKIYI